MRFVLAAAACLLVVGCSGGKSDGEDGSPPKSPAAAWESAPIVPRIAAADRALLRKRVAAGRNRGLRAGVFAKVGDSNTEFSPNVYGLGCRTPRPLAKGLGKVLAAYNRVRLPNETALPGCRPWNSFSRHSASAQAGVISTWPTTVVRDLPEVGYGHKPVGCRPAETPLSCEFRITKPRYAFVMLGTNDVGLDMEFGIDPGSEIGKRLRPTLTYLLGKGVVPILSTIPPITSDPEQMEVYEDAVARTNEGVWKLSKRFGLPMINLWRALEEPSMIDRGISADGLHLSVAGAEGETVALPPRPDTFRNSVEFGPEALRSGANRRNLIWLRTLATLERATG